MIILPDRRLSRGKLLMPVPRVEWRAPSISLPRDQLGNEIVCTRFRLTARLNDGHVVWRGWFEDRDDADAFLFALVSGSLRHERALWRLPTPAWHPGIGTDFVYEFVTQTILTTTGSNQTYTSPSDWNNASNQVECLGGGGSGGTRTFSGGHGAGGGGGAYSAITNFSFASPGTTTATYRVGLGGTAVTASNTAGVAAGATWFNDTVDPGNGTTNAKCSAAGGFGGGTGRPANGGAGGANSSSWGQTKYSGGRGGNATSATSFAATGGGGAAGPSGAGGNGGDTASNVATNGGSANNGTTAGGTSGGSNGGNGTEFSPSYGCGSGSGGKVSGSPSVAGAGGNYGGGSGGASTNGSTANTSAGSQGLIVVEYTPTATNSLANNNLPMLGM